MLRRESTDSTILLIGSDFLLVLSALYISVLIRPFMDLSFIAPIGAGLYVIPGYLYALLPACWIAVLSLSSVYSGVRNSSFFDELSRLVRANLIASFMAAGVIFFIYREISRAHFLLFLILASLFVISLRIGSNTVYQFGWVRIRKPRNVLVVGAGEVGLEVAEQIREHRRLGLNLAGFIADSSPEDGLPAPILGKIDQARKIILTHSIQDVIVALPEKDHEKAIRLANQLLDVPVHLWIIPDYFSLVLHHAAADQFAGFPMFDLRAPALTYGQRLVKRVFDIVVSLLLAPAALLLGVVIAVAIRLDSKGSTFFRQQRVGENGKLFRMYKFRTMVENAEELAEQVSTVDENGKMHHKMPADPRVTRVGKWLRCLSLDELPQLINILLGEMSLVGPRPEMPRLVETYEPWQRKRFAVPQGLTGWWQVNGRSDKPMHLHTDEDLYYIQHYSIWLDLYILLLTIGVVFSRRGAF